MVTTQDHTSPVVVSPYKKKVSTPPKSIRKNFKIMQQASANMKSILKEGATPRGDIDIDDMLLTTSNFSLNVRVVYKYCLLKGKNKEIMIQKFIIQDCNGATCNATSYGDEALTHTTFIEEDDIIKINNPVVVPASAYSLCSSKFDITLRSSTKIEKLTNYSGPPIEDTTKPLAVTEVKTNSHDGDIVTCFGTISEYSDPRSVGDDGVTATAKLCTGEDYIRLTAWGDIPVKTLLSTAIVPENEFIIIRGKIKLYNGEPQLHLHDGCDILTADNPRKNDHGNAISV